MARYDNDSLGRKRRKDRSLIKIRELVGKMGKKGQARRPNLQKISIESLNIMQTRAPSEADRFQAKKEIERREGVKRGKRGYR